jgi:hypothetical protein
MADVDSGGFGFIDLRVSFDFDDGHFGVCIDVLA